MQSFMINAVSTSFDAVASLTEKEDSPSTMLKAINFSTHDTWLYAVSFIGLLLLAFTILIVMKRNKAEEKQGK